MMDKGLEKSVVIEHNAVQHFTNIYTAWHEFLTDNSIKVESMDKMRHPYVKLLLTRMIEPECEQVKIFREVLDETFDKHICQIYSLGNKVL